ncbi:triose-phosphate isomerase family protein [Mycetocola sp. 2940]|uniref:triose-phosphate isomerase family protein n=1 Tax=Mycetocola sp. 2940 TaxID=3156452 RepID=UPI0033960347
MTVYIGASTKMYLGYAQTVAWLDGIAAELDARPGLAGVVPFVIPSFPLLPAALDRLASRGVLIGAQAVSWGDGALTGEVSAALLAEMGVSLVEIGHAERRRHFGETDEVIARKVEAADAAGLRSLLCIGEPERTDPDEAVAFCLAQVRSAIRADAGKLASLIVAYEPIWAIGAAEPADPDYVVAVLTGLRSALAALTDSVPPIVYGGSAGPGLLGRLPAADGLFLGRFAHDPASFARVLDEASDRVLDPT